MDDFYQKVAQIPTKIFRKHSCMHGLRFNSVGDDIGGHEEREAARQKQVKGNAEPVIKDVPNNRGSQWILRRQTAMTSTHKPVNIITQILQKHVRKDKQKLNSFMGSQRKQDKMSSANEGQGTVKMNSRRAESSQQFELKNDKPNFQSMVNIEKSPLEHFEDPFLSVGADGTLATVPVQPQSMSNLSDQFDSAKKMPNQIPAQSHGPSSMKITGMSRDSITREQKDSLGMDISHQFDEDDNDYQFDDTASPIQFSQGNQGLQGQERRSRHAIYKSSASNVHDNDDDHQRQIQS